MNDRETTIKENPCENFKAVKVPILVLRERQLPTDQLSCGSQSANIRLINRRLIVSLSHICPMPGG